jgi:F420-dependent oxidoreductase-like protein
VRLRIFTEPQQGASYDQLLTVARLSEELGFDAFFRSDHYMRIGDGDPGPGSTDAWVTLAAIARETSTIRLGTLVTPATFRLPGPLAISVAQADAMSGGRVELGFGAGWYEAEHQAYGIPFPPTGERFERLEEQLAIVTGLWSTARGDTFAFDGRHYQLSGSPALPKPVQQPHPPIILGGWGTKRTPRLAATYAQEFNVPFAPVDAFAPACDHVRRACERVGRDPSSMRYSVATIVCVGDDEATYRRRAEAIGHDPDALRQTASAGVVGEVIERLRAFGAAGAEAAYLQVLDLDDLDHIRLIASAVASEVASS